MKECRRCAHEIDVVATAWETGGSELQNRMVVKNISIIREALEQRGLCPGICMLMQDWFSRESDKSPASNDPSLRP